MFLKEVVRSIGWHVIKVTPHAREAIACVNRGEACLIVIDDSLQEPAISLVRQMMPFIAYFTTPVFAFVRDEHKFETIVLEKMGQIGIIDKPLTPSRFLPAFTRLIRQWETREYTTLRMCSYRYAELKDTQQFKGWLTKLTGLEALRHAAAAALAKVLLEEGSLREAERILLDALKRNPKNLTTVLTLGDLYLGAALPDVALRFFLSAHRSHEYSCGILPDVIQARMMLNRISEVLQDLEEMSRKHYMREQINPMLARLYLSQGRSKEAREILREKRGLFNHMQKSWEELSGSE